MIIRGKELYWWQIYWTIGLFFVPVFYNGCSGVNFEGDTAAIQEILASSSSVIINSNEKFTNQKIVTLTIQSDKATDMMISNNPDEETEWEPFKETKQWEINQDNSEAKVYARFRTRGVDTEDWVYDNIIHDDVSPKIENTIAPDTWTNKSYADLEYKGTDELSGIKNYLCTASLSEKPEPCKNFDSFKTNIYLNGLEEGHQSYFVRSQDNAGNISEALEVRWNVDTEKPTVNFVGSLPDLSNRSEIDFSFHGQDNASGISHYLCKNKNTNWVKCAPPYKTPKLVDGAQAIVVKSVDNAGNESDEAKHDFEIHTAAPVITFIDPRPENISNTVNTQLGFTGQDKTFTMTQFECRTNGGNFTVCNSPLSLSNLSHGTQVIGVRGKDRFGNWSNEFRYQFIIDTRVNRPFFISTPNRFTKKSQAQFEIGANDGDIASYECKLNTGNWGLCPGGQRPVFNGLEEKRHQIQARVIDQVGNVSSPVFYNWTYDKTPPTLSLNLTSEVTNGYVKTNWTSFWVNYQDNISSQPDIKLECNLDDKGFNACTQNPVPSGLAEGPHKLVVRGTDQAGNIGYSNTINWNVDTTPAKIIMIKIPKASYDDGEHVNLHFNVDNDGQPINSLKCKINGFDIECQDQFEIKLGTLPPANYTYDIEVVDHVGHIVKKQLAWEVKSIGECNGVGNVCIVLNDNFERDELGQNNFGWQNLFHDTGVVSNGIEAEINDLGEGTNGGRYLSFTGRDGASVHSLFLVTRQFDLSAYNRITVNFDYILANLESWKWAGESGTEYLKIEVCSGGNEFCGVLADQSSARSRLNDSSRWMTVFTADSGGNINNHLNGQNHVTGDYENITGNEVEVDLNNIPGNSKSNVIVRITTKMDEGLTAADPDAIIVDNFSIKAYK